MATEATTTFAEKACTALQILGTTIAICWFSIHQDARSNEAPGRSLSPTLLVPDALSSNSAVVLEPRRLISLGFRYITVPCL